MKKLKLSFLAETGTIWGIFWGAFSLFLFFLGILNLWYSYLIILSFILFFIGLLLFLIKIKYFYELKIFFTNLIKSLFKDKVLFFLFIIFLIFLVLNLLLLFAPEIGFDALWYHLTLPKIYLMNHKVGFLDGGLLYYSVMPRLSEMLYGFGLSISSSGFVPRLIHYSFGLFWFFGTYSILRLFLQKRTSFLMALVAYSAPLVTELSGTAYIDLIVAFYAVFALFGFFKFIQTKNLAFINYGALFMGFCLASKLYALLLFISVIGALIFLVRFKIVLKYIVISLIVVLPFYLQALLSTGNPIYPVLSIKDCCLNLYMDGYNSLKDWYLYVWWKKLPRLFGRVLLKDFIGVFVIIVFSPIVAGVKKTFFPFLILLVFFILWSLNPVHEPRYFLMVIPLMALLAGYIVDAIKSTKLSLTVFILVAILLLCNLYNNFKFKIEPIRVALGRESSQIYLKNSLPTTLNYLDLDSDFKNIVKDDKALTINIHNLFYVNFNFIEWSTVNNKLDVKNSNELMIYFKAEKIKYILYSDYGIEGYNNFPKDVLKNNFDFVLQKDHLLLYKLKEEKL